MSWSVANVVLATVAEAKDKINKDENLPVSIKQYILTGLDGILASKGENVRVNVSGHGHLCQGVGSYEVTTAQIHVSSST